MPAYDGTLAYTKRLRELVALLPAADDGSTQDATDVPARLGKVTAALADITRDELAGRRRARRHAHRLRRQCELQTPHQRREQDAFGRAGGAPGALGVNRVERVDGSVEPYGATAAVEMAAGDAFVIETPGGGGYGEPE